MLRMTTSGFARRHFLKGTAAVGAGISFGISRPALAASFPDHPMTFIIPYGPGGSFDAYGRQFSELLHRSLKVNVEPTNMPGAAGKEAIFELYHDRPDGYNISMINVPGILLGKAQHGFDVSKLTWLANLGRDSYGLAVGAKTGIKTVADLKAFSAKRPIKFSSTGAGSTDYFATKILAAALGLRIEIVTGYKGSLNSAVAVARGDVDAVVHSLATLEKTQAAGLVRLIFVFQKKSPIAGVEDATAINQPDLGNIFQWRPVVAPPKLPAAIAATLSRALVAAAKSPAAAKWAAKIHTTLEPLDQQQTLAMLGVQQTLVNKWRKVL